MKVIAAIIGLVIVIGAIVLLLNAQQDNSDQTATEETGEVLEEGERIFTFTPITHASIAFQWGGKTLFVDPVGERAQYPTSSPDIILVTDIHGDHLSTTTLQELAVAQTQLVVPQAVYDLLPSALQEQSVVLRNGATTTLDGFALEAVPMYNLPESTDSRHAKGRGNGYVLEHEGTRVYIAGDTAGTPEMRALQNINVAFIPMNLPYTMSVESAADAVLAFAPEVVYPYHYREESGFADVERFKELVDAGGKDISVVLLDWYQEKEE